MGTKQGWPQTYCFFSDLVCSLCCVYVRERERVNERAREREILRARGTSAMCSEKDNRLCLVPRKEGKST